MDVVSVMAAYCDHGACVYCTVKGGTAVVRVCTALSREILLWCVCVLHCLERHCLWNVNGHDRTIIVILAKHCIKLPADGSLVIRIMLEHF